MLQLSYFLRKVIRRAMNHSNCISSISETWRYSKSGGFVPRQNPLFFFCIEKEYCKDLSIIDVDSFFPILVPGGPIRQISALWSKSRILSNKPFISGQWSFSNVLGFTDLYRLILSTWNWLKLPFWDGPSLPLRVNVDYGLPRKGSCQKKQGKCG